MLEDINPLIGQFKQRPNTLLPSADTVGRGLKELTDCQARDKRKLNFAFNSSFTALNVAKIMCKEHETSIGRLKAQMINAYYAQRIIDVFEKNPNTPLNKERINYCCPVKINRKLCIPLLIGVAAVLLIQGLGFQS